MDTYFAYKVFLRCLFTTRISLNIGLSLMINNPNYVSLIEEFVVKRSESRAPPAKGNRPTIDSEIDSSVSSTVSDLLLTV